MCTARRKRSLSFPRQKRSFVHGVQGVRGFWETSAQVQLPALSLSSPHARKQNFLENDAHRAHHAHFCASPLPAQFLFVGFPVDFSCLSGRNSAASCVAL